MTEQTEDMQIDTSAAKSGNKRTMGTRKNPIHFGRVPNVIKNQSEMSYENDTQNHWAGPACQGTGCWKWLAALVYPAGGPVTGSEYNTVFWLLKWTNWGLYESVCEFDS